MFAISTPSTTPTAVANASACPGSSVCTCTLSAVASPTTRSESPIRSKLLLERVLVELLALDDEDGAVAELGELLMDRVESERLRLHRHLRELLARRTVDHAAGDLDEPGATSVDDTGVRRTSSISGVRATASSPAARTARRSSFGDTRRCSFRSLSSAISRMTVSIVPSTGRFTAR